MHKPIKILIMGLPGSGKTTLAKPFAELLGAVYLNADEAKTQYNDLDSSPETFRMRYLADGVVKAGKIAVADFVCPTETARQVFRADFTVWMDTVKDTSQLFEKPSHYNYHVAEWFNDTDEQLVQVVSHYMKRHN